MRRGLVPEDLILQLIGLCVVVNNQTLKILRALIHDLTERVEIRKHAGILVIELAPIIDDVLAQNKDIVDVRAQSRRDAHSVLHRDNEHGVDVAAVHEEIANIAIADPRRIEQAVIQNQEIPRIDRRCSTLIEILGDLLGNEFLALEHIANN